jgi:hypothetical protein
MTSYDEISTQHPSEIDEIGEIDKRRQGREETRCTVCLLLLLLCVVAVLLRKFRLLLRTSQARLCYATPGQGSSYEQLIESGPSFHSSQSSPNWNCTVFTP